MKFLSYLLGGLSAVAAVGYFVVYLYRWEWQRALISGVLLVVIEIFLVCLVVLSRISRLERRIADGDARAEDVRRRLEQARAESPSRFGWLRDELPGGGLPGGGLPGGGERTYVFVPVLMAAGAVLSFVAWVVQKIATATARPGAERKLAGRLTALTAPPGGAHGVDLEDRPAVGPARSPRATLAIALGTVLVLGAGIFVSNLADATQTRASRAPHAAATTVVFQVLMRADKSDSGRAMAARELWESCRRSTRTVPERAVLTHLDGQVWAGVLRPALTRHDVMRLHGCLRDATVSRARAKVLGTGQAG